MSNAPAFFVPAATTENIERVYASFAEMAGRTVPPPGERVYSITYVHNGEEWTATVGERLCGKRYTVTKSKGQQFERTQSVSDPALVLAIFPGSPFVIVTNHRIAGNVGSKWENPFFAGAPSCVKKVFSGVIEVRAIHSESEWAVVVWCIDGRI
jgi:hypothetical protein